MPQFLRLSRGHGLLFGMLLAGASACTSSSGGGIVPVPPATPVPTATPAPTAPPAPSPIILSPTSLSLIGTGASKAATVSVSEAGYSGTFSASGSTCSNIASSAAVSGGFAITPIAAGICSFTISDTLGQSATLSVTVTTITVGGS